MKCDKCAFENPTHSNFCSKCGTIMSSTQDASIPTVTIQAPITQITQITVGTIFAGRYQILEELGRGGMGRVYKALDNEINENIAIKVLNPEISLDAQTIERFRNELKVARKIIHLNICRLYDLNKEGGNYFITMEYVSGEDLKNTILRVGQLSIGKSLIIVKQICQGLAAAHHLGVVHRDLKPHNIMIDRNGDARIMDFGIARTLKAEGLTESGVLIGTPEYMSPEQALGEEIDERSDIYSLGIILFELLTGTVPFKGDTAVSVALKQKTDPPPIPKTLNSHISDDLNHLILKCLEKDKKQRYKNAEEVISEINSIERGVPTTDKVLPEKEKEAKKPRKPFLKRMIPVGLVLAAVIIIGGYFLLQWLQGPKTNAAAVDKTEEIKQKEELSQKTPSEEPSKEEQKQSPEESLKELAKPTVVQTGKKGFINIDTSPAGATIYVNDKSQGTAPTRSELPPGTYKIRIKHPNYQEKQEEVSIKEGETFTKEYVLRPVYILDIKTTPPDAVVKLDGVFKGETPLLVRWTKATCRLEIEKIGWASVNESMSLKPGKNSITRTLKKGAFTLSVTTNPEGAQVYLGQENLGTSPLEKSISPGTYELRIEKEGYEAKKETLNFESDLKKSYALTKHKPVQLKIVVAPWADVYIDGKEIGQIPPVKNLKIEVGRHTIEFKQLEKTVTKEVTIKPNENLEVYVNMESGEFEVKRSDT